MLHRTPFDFSYSNDKFHFNENTSYKINIPIYRDKKKIPSITIDRVRKIKQLN